MRRAAQVLVNEPVTLTAEDQDTLERAARVVIAEITLQQPGWMGRAAEAILTQFRTFQHAVNRGKRA